MGVSMVTGWGRDGLDNIWLFFCVCGCVYSFHGYWIWSPTLMRVYHVWRRGWGRRESRVDTNSREWWFTQDRHQQDITTPSSRRRGKWEGRMGEMEEGGEVVVG